MKTLSKILIIFFLFFKVTYSEQTEKGINIPGGGFIGNYFVYKDLKIDSKKAEAYDYIILDKLPNLEDFYYNFDYYFNLLNDDISVKHTLYTGAEKKEFDYALGIMDLGNDSNLYYISEIYCDKNGEVKINSGKYKNFPVWNKKELFHKHFKTCSDLENFFDGNKKHKLSIESALDMRYIYFFMMFVFMLGFVFAVFVMYFILLKTTKFTLRFFKLEKYFY